MILIKLGNRIINLDNVKMIELVKEGRGEIVFHFIDGSLLRCKPMGEKDDDFERVWEYLSGLWTFSKGNFI
jgi:hypothetical protein